MVAAGVVVAGGPWVAFAAEKSGVANKRTVKCKIDFGLVYRPAGPKVRKGQPFNVCNNQVNTSTIWPASGDSCSWNFLASVLVHAPAVFLSTGRVSITLKSFKKSRGLTFRNKHVHGSHCFRFLLFLLTFTLRVSGRL